MATTKSSAKSDPKTLADLLEHGLKDLYYAEKKIYKTLPKIISEASDPGLVDALTKHREETEEHINRLEEAFKALGVPAKAVTCEAIDGILKEGDSLLEDFGGAPAGDAAIIFSCQAVEHYEITRYGSLITYAELLGNNDVADILKSTLDEEEAADESLTKVAESSVNIAAVEHATESKKKKP